MRQMIRTIRKEVPEAELLAQLAEEAVELAHAALKLRRTLGTKNPTPITYREAQRNIEEEIADVFLLLDVVGLSPQRAGIINIQHGKLDRWVRRLHDREETDK